MIERIICASRGRNPTNPSDRTVGAPTLTAGTHGDANSKVCTEYRIRKLTPKECWRLMDFSDEDFHKAEKVNSNTQLYKQAGNSIVVNVLVAILGQLFSGKEDAYKNCKVKTER